MSGKVELAMESFAALVVETAVLVPAGTSASDITPAGAAFTVVVPDAPVVEAVVEASVRVSHATAAASSRGNKKVRGKKLNASACFGDRSPYIRFSSRPRGAFAMSCCMAGKWFIQRRRTWRVHLRNENAQIHHIASVERHQATDLI